MFVPVFVRFPTQLTHVKTAASFTADDPWNSHLSTAFHLDDYVLALRGTKSASATPRESRDQGGFRRALRSSIDGITRFLPESLTELWQNQRVPIEALPTLLKAIEPKLRRTDYQPILHNPRLRAFAVIETILCIGLEIIAVIGVTFGHAPPAVAMAVVLGIAGVSWAFLYFVYFGKLGRRRRQMKWLLDYRNAATPSLEHTSAPPEVQGTDLDPPTVRPFRVQLHVPETVALRMESRLRQVIPDLIWQDLAENGGTIRIVGITKEPPHHVIVSLSREESPGPFKLQIRARNGAGEADAFNKMTLSLVQMALHSQLVDPALPLTGCINPPVKPQFYSFESLLEFDEALKPRMALRIKDAIPELFWMNQATDWDEVRIVGRHAEQAQFTAVFITRNESPGPFQVWIHLTAPSKSDAQRTRQALLDRVQAAINTIAS